MSMDGRLLLVMTTCEDRVQAERLARQLVEQRLAACVSMGAPVISAFPWEGKIDLASEVPLTIKTTAGCMPGLKRAFAEHHPYEVPEMVAVPVVDGLEAYFAWAEDWMNDEK